LNKPRVITHFSFADGVLIVFLIFLIIFSSIATYQKIVNYDYAIVEIDGNSREISLANDAIIDLGNGQILEVKDRRIRVKESDCNQQICVKHGWLRFSNDAIVCIPNRTIIYIPRKSELDFITH